MKDREHAMGHGAVVSIHLAPAEGDPTFAVPEVKAVAGAGLEGDRYFAAPGGAPPDREMTLIEQEAIDDAAARHGIALAAGEHRRNVVTTGIRLNDLVGEEFYVGPVLVRGVELAEPCTYLEGLTGKPGLIRALVHRGGLGVEILRDGVIRVGDPVGHRDAGEAPG
jgi:MOSC domain-containing protein YiiM